MTRKTTRRGNYCLPRKMKTSLDKAIDPERQNETCSPVDPCRLFTEQPYRKVEDWVFFGGFLRNVIVPSTKTVGKSLLRTGARKAAGVLSDVPKGLRLKLHSCDKRRATRRRTQDIFGFEYRCKITHTSLKPWTRYMKDRQIVLLRDVYLLTTVHTNYRHRQT